jgi:hypothetical protein
MNHVQSISKAHTKLPFSKSRGMDGSGVQSTKQKPNKAVFAETPTKRRMLSADAKCVDISANWHRFVSAK